MNPLKKEFIGTLKGGHIYLTKKLRETFGLDDGDVLYLQIIDFRPSMRNGQPHNNDNNRRTIVRVTENNASILLTPPKSIEELSSLLERDFDSVQMELLKLKNRGVVKRMEDSNKFTYVGGGN